MPIDPLQLLRLQYGLPPQPPEPIAEANPSSPVTVGTSPMSLARMQLGLPPPQPADNTIEMPDDYVGKGSTIEMPDDYVGKPTEPPPPTPPVDSDLAGSPDFQQEAQASSEMHPSQGPQATTTDGTGAHSDAPVVPGAPPVDVTPAPVEHQPTIPPETDEGRALQISRAIDAAVLPPSLMTADENQKAEANLSPENIAFKGMVQSDQALMMRLNGIQAAGTLAAEEARRRAPDLAQYAAETDRITRESDAAIQNWITNIKRGYDEARDAAVAANAAYPNPDDLLGGKGSWSRAMALGLAAAAAGIPGSTVASVVDQQLRLQMGGRQAEYGQLSQRADALAALAGQQAKSLNDVAGGYQALLQAARDRLAAKFQVIANGLADPTARLGMLNAAADLYERSSKAKFEAGKDLAEIRLKGAQEKKELALAGKAHGGVGVGGLSATAGDSDDAFILGLPKDQRDNALKIPGGGVAIVSNPTLSTEAGKAMLGYRKVIDHIDATLQLTESMPDWSDKVKAKAGLAPEDVLVLQNEIQQAALAGKEAYSLGAISASDMKILEALGADPANASKLNITADKLEAILTNWRRGLIRDANNTVKQYGVVVHGSGKSDFGQTPKRPEAKTIQERLYPLGSVPTADTFHTAEELIGTIDAGIEDARRDKLSVADTLIALKSGRAALTEALSKSNRNLSELQHKVDKMPLGKIPAAVQKRLDDLNQGNLAQQMALQHINELIDGRAKQLLDDAEAQRKADEATKADLQRRAEKGSVGNRI